MEFFLDPRMLPYSISLAIFFIFVFIEIISLLIGIGIFDFLDNIDFDFDFDTESDIPLTEVNNSFSIGAFFGYINPKRVPLSMLLMVFFFLFSFYGAMIQEVLGYISLLITLPIVAFATFISIRYVSSLLSYIIPQVESSAVSVESFIGFEAIILDPISKKNYPARAKVKDKYKNEHYIRVEPLNENEEYKEGDRVIIIQKSKNSNIFFVDISLWNNLHNKKVNLD